MSEQATAVQETPGAAPAPEQATAPQETQPAAPAQPSLGQPGAVIPQDYRETLPEDIKGHAVFEKYGNIEDAMRGLVNAQELIGKKEIVQGIVPPGEDATDEQKAAFRKEINAIIGVPKDAGEYTLGGEKLPEDMSEFAQAAHELNMSNEQFEGVTRVLTELDRRAEEQFTAQRVEHEKANLDALRGAWGGEYDQNMAVANKALEAYGTDALFDVLDRYGLTTEPGIIEHFHKLGAQLEEGGLKAGDTSATQPQSDDARLKELMATEQFANPHMDGGKVRGEVNKLLKMRIGS